MNDEQLRRPSDAPAEQDNGLNGSVDTGDAERGMEASTATDNMAAATAVTNETENNGNDFRPESVMASPEPAAQDTPDMATAPDIATANHVIDAGDMTASEPADVAATFDQPVFT